MAHAGSKLEEAFEQGLIVLNELWDICEDSEETKTQELQELLAEMKAKLEDHISNNLLRQLILTNMARRYLARKEWESGGIGSHPLVIQFLQSLL